MKLLIALLVTFTATTAFAETELACWNMYAKRGSKPIMKAKIEKGNVLEATFNVQDEWFKGYFFDEKIFGDAKKTSELTQPKDALTPEEIITHRSPYVGNNEYTFEFGSYSYTQTIGKKSPDDSTGSYSARLILPPNLSKEFLAKFRIRDEKERSNAVMIMPPPYMGDTDGDLYLRMFCISK